jgi:hypothetical protein
MYQAAIVVRRIPCRAVQPFLSLEFARVLEAIRVINCPKEPVRCLLGVDPGV